MLTVYYVFKTTYGKGVDKKGNPTEWLQARLPAGPFASESAAEDYKATVKCHDTATLRQTAEVQPAPLYENASECRAVFNP